MKPIEVFIRHCYFSPNTQLKNRGRPEWWDMVKTFENFEKTIDPELANYTIVYDEHFGSRDETFLKDEENVITINAGCESGSFLKTLEVIESKNLDNETIVYFLEDDYLHQPNWCTALQEAFELPAHYVSLYDHLDKYLPEAYPDLQSKLFITNSSHWRTTPSCCNTYACTMGQLRQDLEIHKHFSAIAEDGISLDHSKFIELGNKGRILISSVPGWSTQCDSFLSPVIDWEKLQ